MKNFTHTKGPWKFKEYGFEASSNFLVTNESGQLYIAAVDSWSTDKETEGNVKLITAAPDLLKALEDMCKYFKFMVNDPQFNEYKEAIAAIKKATE